MTYAPNPPQHPQPGPPVPPATPNRARTLWLAIGIPIGLILLVGIVAAVVVAWFTFSPNNTVDESATLTDAQSVSVSAVSATLNFLPSADGQTHVTMTGTHAGPAPTLSAQVKDGVAQVKADCPRVWFFSPRCDLNVTVALPADLDVTANGVNGRIILNDLVGDIRVETVNGSINATGTSGDLNLVTINGGITVQDIASKTVTAETVNGSVELAFSSAPSAVSTTSVNGSITVRVPDDGAAYAVDATTVLGKVDTGTIPIDPAAPRTITADTVNGSITVETR